MLRKTYARRRHSVSMLHAHLVFATKYRRQVITQRVFDALRRSAMRTAQALGLVIEAIEADRDHVHLLFAFPPRLPLSTIVQRIKGASSRFIRQQRFPEVLKKLWGRHLWSPSYFVVSCGGAPLDVVKAYVDGQSSVEHQRRARFKRKAGRPAHQAWKKDAVQKTPAMRGAPWNGVIPGKATATEKGKNRPALDPRTEGRGFERDSG